MENNYKRNLADTQKKG